MIGPMAIHILGVVGHAEFIQANILSPTDMLIVGIVAVMLFGNRLPGVARSLGRSLTEFKKGMQEVEVEVKTSIYSEPPNRVTLQDLGQLAAARRESAQLAPTQTSPGETCNR
jgi:TatA/E family protein of Tat protein translocase